MEHLYYYTAETMESLPTPHNNFFHFALSHLPNARGLIETQLSPAALAELKLDTLQLETGSFVDPDLREKFSDLLFSVELANASAESTNRQALVYFLFEHKNQSDPLTVLQVLSYMVRIWEKRIRDGEALCPIVPLLVYHGETAWSAATSLAGLIPTPVALAEYQIHFQPPLLDLSRLDDGEIRGESVLRNTLRLLKYSRSRQLVEKLRDILESICRALPSAWFEEWIKAIEVYIMTVNKNIDHEQCKQTLASILPTQFEPGSLADRLLIQGREEGREVGREEGREAGREEGELIGKIQLLEELLGFTRTSKSELLASDPETLQTKVTALQTELRERYN
ncbi:MAG: Rpn family recombination-promoting nuclease/putative transposase [Planctomycetaceae bacterium]